MAKKKTKKPKVVAPKKKKVIRPRVKVKKANELIQPRPQLFQRLKNRVRSFNNKVCSWILGFGFKDHD